MRVVRAATHAAGERGTPVCTPGLVAEHVTGRDVRVLLGPASELGRAATLRRDDLATDVLGRWLDLVGPEQLVVEVVSHRLPGSGHQFLLNPFGLLYEEVTASSLVIVGLDGQLMTDGPWRVNPAGFVIHSAVHESRDDALCVLLERGGEEAPRLPEDDRSGE